MGISLQDYRSRIGRFQPKAVQIKTKSLSKVDLGETKFSLFILILIFLSAVTSVQLKDQIRSAPDHLPHQLSHIGAAQTDRGLFNKCQDTPHRLTSRDRNHYAKVVNGNRGAKS